MAQVESSKLCVAVVEDNSQSRLSLDVTLRRAGYSTKLYENADAFLARLLDDNGIERSMDLLVADYVMPGTKGGDLIRHLDANGIFFPAVIITAYDTGELEARFAARWGIRFLRKPFAPEDLIAAVQAAYASFAFHRQQVAEVTK